MQVLQKVAPGGSQVAKGALVAEFDQQYQALRLDDQKSALDQRKADLRQFEANLEVTRKSQEQDLEKAKAAVEKAKLDVKTIPVRSAIEAETLRLQLEEAEANLKQIQSRIPYQRAGEAADRRGQELKVRESENELKRAEQNLEKMQVRAPMDGMLVMQNTFSGSEFRQIQQGDQVFPGQMFAQVVDPRSMMVSASANQVDAEQLRVGMKAKLRFDAFPGLELPAHVVSIAAITRPGGQRANFFKEIPVYLKIDRMDPRVIPDLSVSVDIIVESADGQTVVPVESVFRDGDGGEPYVFVKTAAGVEKRPVVLGIRNYTHTAVTSGLKPGETIVLERPPAEGAPTGKAGA